MQLLIFQLQSPLDAQQPVAQIQYSFEFLLTISFQMVGYINADFGRGSEGGAIDNRFRC